MNGTTAAFVDLLRHGETEQGDRFRGSRDDALTARGWEQMHAAIGQVRPWRSIVTSPARRCHEFAQRLAQSLALPLRIDERLRELDFGTWEGKRAAEMQGDDARQLAAFWNDPTHHTPPEGESYPHFHARVLAAWNTLLEADDSALVVTHGGPVRVIIAEILGMPVRHLLRVEVPHASLSRIRLQRDAQGHHAPSLSLHAGRL